MYKCSAVAKPRNLIPRPSLISRPSLFLDFLSCKICSKLEGREGLGLRTCVCVYTHMSGVSGMALTALIFFTMVCRSREVSLWKTNLPDLATQVIISGVRLLHWSEEEGEREGIGRRGGYGGGESVRRV